MNEIVTVLWTNHMHCGVFDAIIWLKGQQLKNNNNKYIYIVLIHALLNTRYFIQIW